MGDRSCHGRDSSFRSLQIVVTRPREDAGRTAAVLEEMGHRVIVEPLLDIRPLDEKLPDPDGLTGLLLTSVNGVRALVRSMGAVLSAEAAARMRGLPAYAVGDQTARMLQEEGFATVLSADGDVFALAALVRQAHPVPDGRLLHVAGTDRAGDLAALLGKHGFTVDRAVLYRAETAVGFSPEFAASLRAGQIDVILFYSPRTAATFARLMATGDLAVHLRVVMAGCLSHTVANTLGGLPFRDVKVADHPRQDSLLALLDEREAGPDCFRKGDA